MDRRCGREEEALFVSTMGECAAGDADGNADGTGVADACCAERLGAGVADDEEEEEEREAGSVCVLFDGRD